MLDEVGNTAVLKYLALGSLLVKHYVKLRVFVRFGAVVVGIHDVGLFVDHQLLKLAPFFKFVFERWPDPDCHLDVVFGLLSDCWLHYSTIIL